MAKKKDIRKPAQEVMRKWSIGIGDIIDKETEDPILSHINSLSYPRILMIIKFTIYLQ